MDTPTTSEFMRSATSDAISSACFALIEQLDAELKEQVLVEDADLADTVLENMITEEAKQETVKKVSGS